jgi:hypothetical protein
MEISKAYDRTQKQGRPNLPALQFEIRFYSPVIRKLLGNCQNVNFCEAAGPIDPQPNR